MRLTIMAHPSQSSFHMCVVVLKVSFMIIVDGRVVDQQGKDGY